MRMQGNAQEGAGVITVFSSFFSRPKTRTSLTHLSRFPALKIFFFEVNAHITTRSCIGQTSGCIELDKRPIHKMVHNFGHCSICSCSGAVARIYKNISSPM